MNPYHWYPGHMTKAIRMMKENLTLVDMIIEVLDARIPLSSRNPDLASLGKNKLRLLLLNKADLADVEATRAWIKSYEEAGITALPLCAKEAGKLRTVNEALRRIAEEKTKKDNARGMRREVRTMICGIPNVGKSTVINALAGRATAKTGNKPGVTKGKQWISLSSGIQMLDTPGVLWPKFEDPLSGEHLAMIGSMNDENFDKADLAIRLIHLIEELYPGRIPEKYGISEEQIEQMIEAYHLFNREGGILYATARNRNLIKRKAEPDYDRASALILDDFRSGKLGGLTLEVCPTGGSKIG